MKIIDTNEGFSLTSSLVTAGIMGIIALGLMRMNEMQIKNSQKNIIFLLFNFQLILIQ